MRPGWGNLQLFGAGKPMEELRDYKIVQEGIAGMERFAGKQQPWCVMVSNNGGHDLYDPPQRFLDMYDWRTIELPKNFRDRMADKPRIYQRMRLQYWEQLSDDEVKQAITHYYALLTMQDELFGMLLKALEKTGEAENTLVIYCSDHGDYAGAHGLWAKGVPSFREGYNIPCAVRWPKGIAQPGRVLEPRCRRRTSHLRSWKPQAGHHLLAVERGRGLLHTTNRDDAYAQVCLQRIRLR
jgi:arylsulfatase A-like enzyme